MTSMTPNPAFNADVPWAALRAGPRAAGQLVALGRMAIAAQRRAWWVGTAVLLVCLFGILCLPALVLTLEWPNNQFGNFLFFGPQFVFPFESLWSKDAHVFEGSMGLVIDLLVWVPISVGFGFFTRRLRAPVATFVGILFVVGATTMFHFVFPVLGWSFHMDGP